MSDSSSHSGAAPAGSAPPEGSATGFADDLDAKVLDNRLPNYHVKERVGSGAMGVVYEAVQSGVHRRVAVKVLPPQLAIRERTVKRFVREAEAMGRLSHTNIVDIYEVSSGTELHYFAMRFVEGPSLDIVLKAGPMAIADVLRIGIEIAGALAHAHSRGVLHRDVKPSNILRDEERVVLTDFGLARPIDPIEAGTMTESGDMVGTPLYMSPEQIFGDPSKIDGRSDTWGLGATLYELLTQQPPFGGSNAQSILNAILHKDAPLIRRLRKDVPQDLEAVILKCLEKNPARRYSTAAALKEDLEAIQAGESVTASRPQFYDPAIRWVRRHPVQASVAALLLVVIGALFAWTSSSNKQLQETRDDLDQVSLLRSQAERAKVAAEQTLEQTLDQKEFVQAQRVLVNAREAWLEAHLNRVRIATERETTFVVSQRRKLDAELDIWNQKADAALSKIESMRRAYPPTENLDIAREVMQVSASIMHTEGRDEEAIAFFAFLEQELPTLDDRHYAVRAAAFAGLQRWEEAIQTHQERIRLDPRNADAYHRLGRMYVEQHLAAEADAATPRRSVMPGDPLARYGLKYLEQAEGLATLQRNDALRSEIILDQARCLMALDRLYQAQLKLESAIANDRSLATAIALLDDVRQLIKAWGSDAPKDDPRAFPFQLSSAEDFENLDKLKDEFTENVVEESGKALEKAYSGMMNLLQRGREDPGAEGGSSTPAANPGSVNPGTVNPGSVNPGTGPKGLEPESPEGGTSPNGAD